MSYRTSNSRGQIGAPILIIGIIILILLGGWYWYSATTEDEEVLGDSFSDNTSGLYDDTNIGDLAHEADDVEQIDDNPSLFIGQTLTVDGEVAEVHSANSFTLASTDLIEDQVLVISRNPLPTSLTEDVNDIVDEEERVRVTGVVREYIVAEIEQELSIDLDPELEIEINEREPVLIVDSVIVVDENTIPDTTN